jgi:predicted metal-dependent peptidase
LSKEFGMLHPFDNIAMDLSINSRLLESNDSNIAFIEGGQLPKNYPGLKLNDCEGSLYYYQRIIQAQNDKINNGTCGDKAFDDVLDNLDKTDQHLTWEQLTEGLTEIEKEILKRKVIHRLQEISQERGVGSAPSWLNLDIVLKEPYVSWKSIIRKFIGCNSDNTMIQNRNRPSKRFELNPSNKIKYKTAGVFLMDSSGSVSNDDLLECNAELFHLYKAGSKIHYASWDGVCEPVVEYTGKLEMNRTLSGGTDINCAITEINQNYKKYRWSFAVITTDGYIGSIDVRCKIPLLILITPNGTTTGFQNTFNNKILKMN